MGRKSRQKWVNREEKAQSSKLKAQKLRKFKKFFLVIIFLFLVIGGSTFSFWKNYFSKTKTASGQDKEIAVMETNKGIIKFRLYRSAAPKTVENFVKLVNEGFYSSIKFHRVISDFMIQTGDPLSRDDDPSNDGTGGPGYAFDDEINPWSIGVSEKNIKILQEQGYTYDKKLKSKKNVIGAVSMANSGPNTNGSQFFIITQKDQLYLDGKHTVFGMVIEGMDIVQKIEQNDVIEKIYIITDEGENNNISQTNKVGGGDNNIKIENINGEGDGILDLSDIKIKTE